jgi:hypothetical protein
VALNAWALQVVALKGVPFSIAEVVGVAEKGLMKDQYLEMQPVDLETRCTLAGRP